MTRALPTAMIASASALSALMFTDTDFSTQVMLTAAVTTGVTAFYAGLGALFDRWFALPPQEDPGMDFDTYALTNGACPSCRTRHVLSEVSSDEERTVIQCMKCHQLYGVTMHAEKQLPVVERLYHKV